MHQHADDPHADGVTCSFEDAVAFLRAQWGDHSLPDEAKPAENTLQFFPSDAPVENVTRGSAIVRTTLKLLISAELAFAAGFLGWVLIGS